MLKAFEKSTLSMILPGSLPNSFASPLPRALQLQHHLASTHQLEEANTLASSDVASQQHFDASRRIVSPIAIGRSPPPCFTRAIGGAPAMKGASSRGAKPATMWFVSRVKADSAASPTALLEHARMSLKNRGRVPEDQQQT